MGISKSQAAALADGFLDRFGEDKTAFNPQETVSELFLLAGDLILEAQENLNANNSNASGGLSSSLELQNPVMNGKTISVDILMAYYGQFVDQGVKGTESGEGKFQFKNSFPNKKMALALLQGIRKGRNKTRNTDLSKTKSKNELKNGTIGALNGKAAAYGAAVNIKKYGIKPTGFLNRAIETTSQKIQERLGAALAIDIIKTLPDKL